MTKFCLGDLLLAKPKSGRPWKIILIEGINAYKYHYKNKTKGINFNHSTNTDIIELEYDYIRLNKIAKVLYD